MYEFQIKKMKQIQKSSFSFRFDFAGCSISDFVKDGDDYVMQVTGYKVSCKGSEVISNGKGELHISVNDVIDSQMEDELYDRMYKELIDDVWDAWEKEHEDDPDYGTNYEIMSQEAHRRNHELDEMFENIVYELKSVQKIPSFSIKGTLDDYEGASLDDEYKDELKVPITGELSLSNGMSMEFKVKTEYSAFIPSDDDVYEMLGFMETEE